MSGHSRWSTIKRKKSANDAARGNVFTKIIREITVSAKLGGGDTNSNSRLRLAIQNAKTQNMPQSNIIRAIKKGTGELEGSSYEEVLYEGYGPGGVALIIESLTDNKKRTVAELRHLMSRNGGNLAEAGSVSWNFERKGVIHISKGNFSDKPGKAPDLAPDLTEDDLFGLILEAGADDIVGEEDFFEVTTSLENFDKVRTALLLSSHPKLKIENTSLHYVAKTNMKLEGKDARQTLRLIGALEDYDDVQNVYTNADIDESVMAELNI